MTGAGNDDVGLLLLAMSVAVRTIDLLLKSPATGQVDAATGRVTLNADVIARVFVDRFGERDLETRPQVLSTEGQATYPGARFLGGRGFPTGKGAFAASWNGFPAGTDPACGVVDPTVQGPAGFWIARGIVPGELAPKLALRSGSTVRGQHSAGQVRMGLWTRTQPPAPACCCRRGRRGRDLMDSN